MSKIGDFGDRNPEGLGSVEEHRRQRINIWKARESSARQAIEDAGSTLVTQKVLVLVDLQGMYLGLHEYLSTRGFPIDGGLIMSRFATFQILDVFDRIKYSILAKSGGTLIDFDEFMIRSANTKISDNVTIRANSVYVTFNSDFELFYAPADFSELDLHLKNAARSYGGEAATQAKLLASGRVRSKGWDKERNYAAYNDFISKLGANPEYLNSHEGFFSTFGDHRGITMFKEKEVDVRIAIRSMEALFRREADALCIVSSDQDFLPLRAKSTDFGVRYFHADLGKFENEKKIAKNLRGLGANFLPGKFKKEWPYNIIKEATPVPALNVNPLYAISEEEIEALCMLHNTMNSHFLIPSRQSDGSMSIAVQKPIRPK